MKKFIIIVAVLILLYVFWDITYYRFGWYIDLHPEQSATTSVTVRDGKIYQLKDGEWTEYIVKGVDMGSGIPGEWSTDFKIDQKTYFRWFEQIQEMGANTLRMYTIQADDFYNAFYEYNKDRENPLYLIQGVWVNDYIQNSHRDAFDKKFLDALLKDCKTMIDVIHGNKKITPGEMASAGSGNYRKDISPWVIGYIFGVEWEDVTVAYTDEKFSDVEGYDTYLGEYMYTSEDATPFEAMLTRVGDTAIGYESKRYKQQRLVAFSNWPTTDPFTYPEDIERYFRKCACVDVEHILCTDNFLAGQFVSYHVYPYFPDYLSYIDNWSEIGISDKSIYYTADGGINTYRAYLSMLTEHHTMPVVISEFGVSTGRGMAQRDRNTGRSQGNMSEKEQGQALIDCWEDIMASGCAGGCIFTWQDEWFKRTWNTMYAVDLTRTPYWSDYQTNEQYFGMLSFDPGKEKSVCYVDGDISEWTEDDLVTRRENASISMKYDEKFVYFLIYKKDLAFGRDTLYIPIDTTQKTGSYYCDNFDLRFMRAADFLLVLHGQKDSRLMVQERAEALRANYAQNVYDFDAYEKGNVPDENSPLFVNIDMILQTATVLIYNDAKAKAEVFETGILTYGNANPESPQFDSLADFICAGDYIELKLPWQLLNFADPSKMMIHDDYYDDNYGVVYQNIDKLYVGLGFGGVKERIGMDALELDGWGNKVTSHERLKSSYYIMKEYWTAED